MLLAIMVELGARGEKMHREDALRFAKVIKEKMGVHLRNGWGGGGWGGGGGGVGLHNPRRVNRKGGCCKGMLKGIGGYHGGR